MAAGHKVLVLPHPTLSILLSHISFGSISVSWYRTAFILADSVSARTLLRISKSKVDVMRTRANTGTGRSRAGWRATLTRASHLPPMSHPAASPLSTGVSASHYTLYVARIARGTRLCLLLKKVALRPFAPWFRTFVSRFADLVADSLRSVQLPDKQWRERP